MEILHAILLGVIQGITEWLPVSSSGHLVLAQQYFNLEVPVAFDVMLHLGTLLVVLIVFWKDIMGIIRSVIRLKWDDNTKLLSYVLVATVPIAVVGFLFKGFVESLFDNVLAVGIALLITGTVLFFTRFAEEKHKLNWWNCLIVGIAQAFALVPGISRSGSTISAGLFLGLRREKIARFSFLMFVPAMVGAGVLELKDLGSVEPVPVILAALTTVFVGYFSLVWLLKVIKNGKFYNFSWYCWALGLLAVILSLV